MPSIPDITFSITTTNAPPGGEQKNNSVGISAGVISAALFVVIFIALYCLKRRMHKNNQSSQSTRSRHSSDSDDVSDDFDETNMADLRRQISCSSTKSLDLPLWRHVDRELKKTIKSHLVEYQCISMGAVVGKGQFGLVHEALLARDSTRLSNNYGTISHTKVAVKTLRGNNLSTESIESFLREGLIMKDFNHKNVLSLVGVSIDPMGVPLIVLPFMANGNLKKYLMNPEIMITVRNLLRLAVQIAQGMAYLAQHKFVHRDLAARNCMIDEDMVVKVADFGLSRDIYTREYYSSQDTRAKLPVKWMAIESLSKALYTCKSDVWSFGVVLWEILTRGATPYPDVPNWEVRAYVQAGNRMERPEACPPEVYTLMLSCWSKDPDKRPKMAHIVEQLEAILDPCDQVDGEDPDDDYYNAIVDATPEMDNLTDTSAT